MLRQLQKNTFIAGAGLLSALTLGLSFAQAATSTANFQVTAMVQATCMISAGNLDFGTYTGTATTATSSISVTCTNTTPYNVGLNAGSSSGATVTTRKMADSGGDTLSYGLYQDAAYSLNWGDTTGTDTVAGTGDGSTQTLTVYGQLPAGQYVTPGSYSDTVTATVYY